MQTEDELGKMLPVGSRKRKRWPLCLLKPRVQAARGIEDDDPVRGKYACMLVCVCALVLTHVWPIRVAFGFCMSGTKWIGVLEALWPSTTSRLHAVCRMLASNGFFHPTQLRKLSDVTALAGSDAFTGDELQVLRELQSNRRQAPATIQPGALVPEVAAGKMDNVPSKFQLSDAAKGKGPMAAIRSLKLEEMTPQQRAQWAETVCRAFVMCWIVWHDRHRQARVEAILGGMNQTIRSWKSGVRCYVAFHSTNLHCVSHVFVIMFLFCKMHYFPEIV